MDEDTFRAILQTIWKALTWRDRAIVVGVFGGWIALLVVALS